MPLSLQDILEILKLVNESRCEEFRLETADVKLIVRKAGAAGAGEVAPADGPPLAIASAASPPELTVVAPTAGPAQAGGGDGQPEPVPDGMVAVRAPMVGTFYRAPTPGAPPFVEVGARVKEDDTVCILEVMKLMNSIAAGVRGRVARICAENAALVTQGQTLVLIEPEEAERG